MASVNSAPKLVPADSAPLRRATPTKYFVVMVCLFSVMHTQLQISMLLQPARELANWTVCLATLPDGLRHCTPDALTAATTQTQVITSLFVLILLQTLCVYVFKAAFQDKWLATSVARTILLSSFSFLISTVTLEKLSALFWGTSWPVAYFFLTAFRYIELMVAIGVAVELIRPESVF